jgi:hypothetical protein
MQLMHQLDDPMINDAHRYARAGYRPAFHATWPGVCCGLFVRAVSRVGLSRPVSTTVDIIAQPTTTTESAAATITDKIVCLFSKVMTLSPKRCFPWSEAYNFEGLTVVP